MPVLTMHYNLLHGKAFPCTLTVSMLTIKFTSSTENIMSISNNNDQLESITFTFIALTLTGFSCNLYATIVFSFYNW